MGDYVRSISECMAPHTLCKNIAVALESLTFIREEAAAAAALIRNDENFNVDRHEFGYVLLHLISVLSYYCRHITDSRHEKAKKYRVCNNDAHIRPLMSRESEQKHRQPEK